MTHDPYGSGPQDSNYSGYQPYGGQSGWVGPYGPQSQPPYGPVKPPGSETAMWAPLGAVLCYAGAMVFPPAAFCAWLPAVVIRNSAQNQGNPLIRHHTTQTINATLTGLIIGITTLVLTIAGILGGIFASSGSGSAAPAVLMVIFVVLLWMTAIAHGVASLIYLIIAATRANSGQYFTYPRWWIAFPLIQDEIHD